MPSIICEGSSAEEGSADLPLFVSNILSAVVCLSAGLVNATGFLSFRKSGPVNHLEFKSSGTEIGLVPMSAGLSLVAIYDH